MKSYHHKITWLCLPVILCVVFLLYSFKAGAMSLLFGTDIVLFSPMEGALTYEGKPAANAKMTRTIIWKGDKGETDMFYANDKGEFSLPRKSIRTRIPLLAEFVLTQELSVFYQGKEFTIWVKSKQDLTENGELGGKPKNLRCELSDEDVYLEGFNGLFTTSCKWDSIQNRGI